MLIKFGFIKIDSHAVIMLHADEKQNRYFLNLVVVGTLPRTAGDLS